MGKYNVACGLSAVSKIIRFVAVALVLIALLQPPLSANVPAEHLQFLAPLAGVAWQGQMRLPPDGKKTAAVTVRFELMWGGAAVRYTRAIPDLKFAQEGYFYWDAAAQKTRLFVLDSRGDAGGGDVALADGQVTVTGRLAMGGKEFDYKNTFTIGSDGKLTDRWFQNAAGSWQTGHVIVFDASR
jgi:hypothetical protein